MDMAMPDSGGRWRRVGDKPKQQRRPGKWVPSNADMQRMRDGLPAIPGVDMRAQVDRVLDVANMGTDEFMMEAVIALTTVTSILLDRLPPNVDGSDPRFMALASTTRKMLESGLAGKLEDLPGFPKWQSGDGGCGDEDCGCS